MYISSVLFGFCFSLYWFVNFLTAVWEITWISFYWVIKSFYIYLTLIGRYDCLSNSLQPSQKMRKWSLKSMKQWYARWNTMNCKPLIVCYNVSHSLFIYYQRPVENISRLGIYMHSQCRYGTWFWAALSKKKSALKEKVIGVWLAP